MFKEVQLSEIETDGFLHSSVNDFIIDNDKKIFILYLNHADLKIKGSFYSCAITITDWWNLEVFEYNKQQKIKQFNLDEIPEIDRIIKFSFNDEELILTDFGMHHNTAIDYKFTKPKIQITGEYDPD